MTMIVLPLIIRILLICNNIHNKSDNNCDNLAIITVIMRIIIKIIHWSILFLWKNYFCNFILYMKFQISYHIKKYTKPYINKKGEKIRTNNLQWNIQVTYPMFHRHENYFFFNIKKILRIVIEANTLAKQLHL